ncbi:MAG: ssDNA-binding domain-containing protein, partial [Ruminococcus sp.]|nr:ssDNA-binding domain-containing protein [Ruminococcus sp.]
MKQSKMREEMAAEFVRCLNEEKIPWRKVWSVKRQANALTGNEYKGVNQFWLSFIANENGWEDSRWVTFTQAKKQGWSVKAGSHGTHIEYWSAYDTEKKKNISFEEAQRIIDSDPDSKERFTVVTKNSTVFNGEQIDGIPPYEDKEKLVLSSDKLLSLRDTLIDNMKISFSEGGEQAFYNPLYDKVTMPKVERFIGEYEYMATFFHECAHATGHESRMNRALSGGFGSEEYAKEELRAEIASAFTAMETGISGAELENHKAYIQSWARVIESNPDELFRAIKDAEKITDYLIEKSDFREKQLQQTIAVSEDEPARKIEQNRREEKLFKEQLHRLIEGDKKLASRPLIIGKTPNSLVICGADGSYDLQILKSVVDKALKPENRDENGKLVGKTGHGLTEKQLINVIDNIKNPVMILRGSKENSLVVVTEIKDNKGREIIAAIALDKRKEFSYVNNITSTYGRDDFAEYIENQFKSGNLIAVNKEKADRMLHSIGKWYPEENTFISFDNSITYTTANVKGFEAKDFEKIVNFEKEENEAMPEIEEPLLEKYAEINEQPLDASLSSYKVSEDEQLRIARKIEQNRREEKLFKEQLHRLIEGDKKLASRPLIIGKTPNSLVICGADGSYDLQILKSVVDKALKPENRDENGKLVGKTGHGLTEKQLINAIENIKNPVMILRGSKDNSLVAVTEIKDNNDRYVFVTIDLNKKTRYGEVNNITSSYGRDDIGAYFEREFSKGNLLSVNIEKADRVLHAIGKWYPEENTFISFDNSITYTTANVKGFEAKDFEKIVNFEKE